MEPTNYYLNKLRQNLEWGSQAGVESGYWDSHKWSHGDGDMGIKESRSGYAKWARLLDDPETKRMIYDSRQAGMFADLVDEDEEIPRMMQSGLHLPFQQFYLEFTEPMLVGEPEPGYPGQDYLRAILVYRENFNMSVPHKVPKLGDGEDMIDFGRMICLVFFYDSMLPEERAGFADRTCLYDVSSGLALTRIRNVIDGPDPSDIPEDWKSELDAYIPSTMPLIPMEGDRHIGWWERITHANGSLFSWMLAYMMAKSIVIEEQALSRPQRRFHERKNIIPKPWHIVKVDPKIMRKFQGGEGEAGREHGYRYDVIGHLRFQKVRYKDDDGNWRQRPVTQWVAPHQRGLQHSLYIPKTYKVERGKTVAPLMRQYFGEGGEKV